MPGTSAGKGAGKGSSGGSILAPPEEKADVGLNKKRATRAKKLAELPVAERNWHIEQLKEAGKGVTPKAKGSAAMGVGRCGKRGANVNPHSRRRRRWSG
jgi:hypothetical protein